MKYFIKIIFIASIIIGVNNFNTYAVAEDCSTETKLEIIDNIQYATPIQVPSTGTALYLCKTFTLINISCLLTSALVTVYTPMEWVPQMWAITTTCATTLAILALSKQQMYSRVENFSSQQHIDTKTDELCEGKNPAFFNVDSTGTGTGDLKVDMYCSSSDPNQLIPGVHPLIQMMPNGPLKLLLLDNN